MESLAALPEQAFPLLPYICTTFAQHRADGRPLVRAMVLDEDFIAQATACEQGALDSTENPHNVAPGADVKDEFVLGPSLLVAPVFAWEMERFIVLPRATGMISTSARGLTVARSK